MAGLQGANTDRLNRYGVKDDAVNRIMAQILARRGGTASGRPQAFAPMNPLDAGDGMALADPFGGAQANGGDMSGMGGAVVSPGMARPAPPVFAPRQYGYPTAPTIPELGDAPVRNIGRENRQGQKMAMQAGLVGLLLGGLPGATNAATGAMEGAGQTQDRLAAGDRQAWQDANQSRLQRYGLERQGYGDAVEQIGQQMRGDTQADQLAMRQYLADVNDYGKEQERLRKQESDADKNALRETQLDNQRLIGLLNAGANVTRADSAKALVDPRIKQMEAQTGLTGARTYDVFADNTRADSALALKREHDAWMKASTERRTKIAEANQSLRAQAASNKGSITPVQQANILDRLNKSQFLVNSVRAEAGDPPAEWQGPEAMRLWQARKLEAEETAKALREGYNTEAAIIGYRWDGRGYVPMSQPPPPPPARGMTPQEGADMLSGADRTGPVILPSRQIPANPKQPFAVAPTPLAPKRASATPKPVSQMTPQEKLAELAAIAGKK